MEEKLTKELDKAEEELKEEVIGTGKLQEERQLEEEGRQLELEIERNQAAKSSCFSKGSNS